MGGQSHTAGPWSSEERTTGMTHIYGSDGSAVCYLKTRYGPRRGDFEANARLIAAAPELLEALESALAYVERFEDVRDGDYGAPEPNEAMSLASELRAAIQKATGESAE